MLNLRATPPAPQPIPRACTPLRFSRHDRIVIDNVDYVFRSADRNTITLARADDSALTETISREQMNVLRHSRGYRHDRNFYSPEATKAQVKSGVQSLRDLPDEEQDRILWMQQWVLLTLKRRKEGLKDGGLSYSDLSLQIAIPLIAEEIAKKDKARAAKGKKKRAGRVTETLDNPCPKTLRRWIRALIEGNMNPLALRYEYRKCGNHTPKLAPEAYAYLHKFAWKAATPEKPNAKLLWKLMSAAISVHNNDLVEDEKQGKLAPGQAKALRVKVPSYDRLREEIDKIPAFDLMAGQEGIDVAKNYFRAVTTGNSEIVRPLQRVEFDEWKVHLHILFTMAGVWDTLTEKQKAAIARVRMVLCVAIDVATKCVLGMSLARTESSENALRCLDMAVSDKQEYAATAGALTPYDMCGTMEGVVADAGSTFGNYKFLTAVVDLSAIYEIAPAGVPYLRGTVERVFRTTDTSFIALFAGRTFSNVVDKGDYDSEARASLDVEELALALVRYKVDHYHNHPHEGLGGETPRACWLRLTAEFGVDAPPDDHLRRIVFGQTLSPVLGAHGVRVLGIDYNSFELNALFRMEGPIHVEVRVDHRNLGAISAKIGNDWVLVEGPEELHRVTAEDWISVWDEFQASNAEVNEITRPILDQTMAHLAEIGRLARARVNIAQEPMDQETLQYHQKRMNVGVKFAKEAVEERRQGRLDVLDGALIIGPNSGEPAPALSAPADAVEAPPLLKAKKQKAQHGEPKQSKDQRPRWTIEE